MRYSALSLCSAVVTVSAVVALAQTQSPGTAVQLPTSAEREVSGTVEMKTPDEIVLGTDAGLKHFAITAETEHPLDFAQGDDVDLWYIPEGNGHPARVTRVAHSTRSRRGARVASATTPRQTAATPVETNKVAETTPPPVHRAVTHAAVASPQATKSARLPKTASDLPLIGLLGLVSLAGAGVVRAIRLG